jgi:hypothetical protein
VKGGILHILTAMRVFLWDERVQTKANWALANLAATYADYIGKQGGVEAVITGMQTCAEAYQVQISGTRCLQNLVHGSSTNLQRAKLGGAIDLLTAALQANPEDGQLQWRGTHLLEQLQDAPGTAAAIVAAADAAAPGAPPAPAAAATISLDVSRSSPWSEGKSAALSSRSRDLAKAQVPGLHGPSAVVAAEAQKGIAAVLDLLRTRGIGHNEIAMWCFDAVATLINGNAENREIAFKA